MGGHDGRDDAAGGPAGGSPVCPRRNRRKRRSSGHIRRRLPRPVERGGYPRVSGVEPPQRAGGARISVGRPSCRCCGGGGGGPSTTPPSNPFPPAPPPPPY